MRRTSPEDEVVPRIGIAFCAVEEEGTEGGVNGGAGEIRGKKGGSLVLETCRTVVLVSFMYLHLLSMPSVTFHTCFLDLSYRRGGMLGDRLISASDRQVQNSVTGSSLHSRIKSSNGFCPICPAIARGGLNLPWYDLRVMSGLENEKCGG